MSACQPDPEESHASPSLNRRACRMVSCVGCRAGCARKPPAPDGWVVLPVDEYRTLRDRALGVVPPLPPPPVEATLTRVDYELHS